MIVHFKGSTVYFALSNKTFSVPSSIQTNTNNVFWNLIKVFFSSIQWLCKLSFYLLMPGNHSTIYIYSIVNRTLWDEEEKLSFGHGQLQNSSYQRTFYCLIQWQYQKIKFSARQYSKISKKLPNFLLSDFGQLHGVRIFSSTNQKGLDEWWEIHRNLFLSCFFKLYSDGFTENRVFGPENWIQHQKIHQYLNFG